MRVCVSNEKTTEKKVLPILYYNISEKPFPWRSFYLLLMFVVCIVFAVHHLNDLQSLESISSIDFTDSVFFFSAIHKSIQILQQFEHIAKLISIMLLLCNFRFPIDISNTWFWNEFHFNEMNGKRKKTMVRKRRIERKKNNHFWCIYTLKPGTLIHTNAAHSGTERNSFCQLQMKMFYFHWWGGGVNFTLCAPCAHGCRFQCKRFVCTATKTDVYIDLFIQQFVRFFFSSSGFYFLLCKQQLLFTPFIYICFSSNCNGNDFGKALYMYVCVCEFVPAK